jgi:flagellar biosynthesis GTPase FlhF
VEVMSCLSAIHSEIYNKKILNQIYREIDGVCFTHADLCLNYATILNIHWQYNTIPLMFLSSGPVIPKDVDLISQDFLIKQILGL